ncbi:hypothetical protein SMQE08_34700 [Serratia marcescens]|nr:hypothetical protein SMQE08_34700 [Serratia marcescens]
MVIHIISDDNFFALGCEEAIKTCNTYKTKKYIQIEYHWNV